MVRGSVGLGAVEGQDDVMVGALVVVEQRAAGFRRVRVQ